MVNNGLGLISDLRKFVLDQRLVRDNPNLIARELSRRGIEIDMIPLQKIAQQQRDLQKERSNLQAEGNLVGKEVGQKIKSGIDPQSNEVKALRLRGNEIKAKVANIEECEKTISYNLKEKLLSLPNIPSKECLVFIFSCSI